VRAGGGKAKGGAFERQVCKQLSRWMSRGLRDDLFWRSAVSGGRATISNRNRNKNTTQVGDITAIDPRGAALTGRFVIECKYVKDLDLHGLFFPEQFGHLFAFWTTLQDVAERAGKMPMLIARQNFFPPTGSLVCISYNGNITLFPDVRYEFVRVPPMDMCVIQIADFLKYASRP
jgi:hypothetical protein